MKKSIATLAMATLMATCITSHQASASETNAIQFSGKLHAARLTAAEDSTLRLTSIKLHGSNLGSNLQMKTQARLGQQVTLKKGAQLRVASLDMNNGYINGPANLQMNVQVQREITGAQNSDIGIGGMQITADENYNPSPVNQALYQGNNRFLTPGSSLQPMSGSTPLTGKKISLSEVERYLLFAHMSQDVYGESPARLKGWVKVYDSNTNKSWASRAMKLFGGHAVAYRNPKTNELITVFEGTRNPAEITSHPLDVVEDIAEDVLARFGPTPQYAAGQLILNDIWNTWGKNNPGTKMVVSGHSLGGGIAQYAGAKLAMEHSHADIEGVIFNPADLGISADTELLANRDKLTNITMTEIRINGDSVSAFQGIRTGTVFPRSTVYELPTNKGAFSDHGIDVIIEKIEENKSNFESCKVPDTMGNIALNKLYKLN